MYNVTYTLKNVNYWNILSKSYFSYTVYTQEILYLLFLYRTKMEFSFHHEHIIAMNHYLKTNVQMYGKFCSNNNLLLFLYKFFFRKTTFFNLFLFSKPLLTQLESCYVSSLTKISFENVKHCIAQSYITDFCICSTSKHLYSVVVLYSCRFIT